MTLNEQLKNHMEKENLTAHELSMKTGAQIATISRWINNKKISFAWEQVIRSYLSENP